MVQGSVLAGILAAAFLSLAPLAAGEHGVPYWGSSEGCGNHFEPSADGSLYTFNWCQFEPLVDVGYGQRYATGPLDGPEYMGEVLWHDDVKVECKKDGTFVKAYADGYGHKKEVLIEFSPKSKMAEERFHGGNPLYWWAKGQFTATSAYAKSQDTWGKCQYPPGNVD